MQSSSLASASLPNHQRLLYFISQYSVITHVVQLPNKINVSFLNVIKGEQPLLIPQLLLKYILSAVMIWNRTILHEIQQGNIAGIFCNYLTL